MRSLKTHWRIFWMLRKMHLQLMFEYRTDFFFWSLISAMWSIFHFFFLFLITGITGRIGDWNSDEILVLTSVFTIFDAFTWSFFYFNMNRYVQFIFSGELDGFLLKPVDTQFYLSVNHNSYNNVFRLIIGLIMLVYSLNQLDQIPSLIEITGGLILMLCGLLLIYSLWFLIATLGFWVEKIDNINDVIPSLRRVTQVPREVYQGVFSMIFCVIFPLVLSTSIPAEWLIGKANIAWTIYFVVATFTLFLLTRVFFRFSLLKYSGAGS